MIVLVLMLISSPVFNQFAIRLRPRARETCFLTLVRGDEPVQVYPYGARIEYSVWHAVRLHGDFVEMMCLAHPPPVAHSEVLIGIYPSCASPRYNDVFAV